MAPSDVWLDKWTICYIQGSLPADTPAHESTRAARRANVFSWHTGKLYREVPDRVPKQVPAPAERGGLIKFMHGNHGHFKFGVKRTTALLHPFAGGQVWVEMLSRLRNEFRMARQSHKLS
eukprot:1158746-Pelagomonas_calceolata.AAC.12